LISIVLWPLAVGLEKIVDFVNGLETEDQKQQNLEKLDMSENFSDTPELSRPAAADFPLELIFTGVLGILFILLIFWLRKIKTNNERGKKESKIEVERFSSSPVHNVPEPTTVSYASIDKNIIREAFRDFERMAAEADKGRKSHETMREWLKRMDWNASDAFYETYNFVRYGNGPVSESIALPFLNEINKLKEQYLKINV